MGGYPLYVIPSAAEGSLWEVILFMSSRAQPRDLYGRLSSLCHPERSRGISMGGYPLYVIPSLSRDLYGRLSSLCHPELVEGSLWEYRPLCHFEGARRFTLLAKGKTSAPQSAAYGRMPMATCCRKRQLFSCRLPSASERRNLWKNPARILYSLFGNADCIQPSRGGAKTHSTRRHLAARSG